MERVLSNEEVEALLKVAQEKNSDLTELIGSQVNQDTRPEYNYALTSITELMKVACEDVLSSFLRKKIAFQLKDARYMHFSDCLKNKTESHIYCLFHIMPNDYYGLLILDYSLLHHSINLLYGGHLNKDEAIMTQPGKVALIVAEKIGELVLEGFSQACIEYAKIDCQIVKTVQSVNLITKINAHDHCFVQEYSVGLDEMEAALTLIVEEGYLIEALPARVQEFKPTEQNTWRIAIQGQLMDARVMLNAVLPEVTMKVNDFIALKADDVIPIGDPTDVYICLNTIKLFKAKAGQNTSMRVAKIENEF